MKIYNKKISLFNWKRIKHNITAFTIAEVLISTIISAIVLSFILIFMFDITDWIKESKKEVQSMESLYELITELNNVRNTYSSGYIIEGPIWWSDTLYMRNVEWTDWMLFWPVRTYDNLISSDTNSYNGRSPWFKRLFSEDIIEIEANNAIIVNYRFLPDRIYYDLDLQSMNLSLYNTWEIIDLSITFDINYNQDLIWTAWTKLSKDSLRTFNINF